MHRDPQEVEGGGPSPRAWGIGLGIWFAVFVALAFLVVPVLFGRCGV